MTAWRRNRQQGFGLIEVLISMLVFALGVLGVAGMQGQAIRVTHDSLQRSMAVWLANEASERMKVNPGGLDSGRYETVSSTASADLDAYCAGTPPASCIGATCTVEQMTDYDIYDLLCNNPGLIDPMLNIVCSGGPCNSGSLVNVTVSWNSRGATGGVFSIRQELTITMRR